MCLNISNFVPETVQKVRVRRTPGPSQERHSPPLLATLLLYANFGDVRGCDSTNRKSGTRCVHVFQDGQLTDRQTDTEKETDRDTD